MTMHIAIESARWAVTKALGPVTDGLFDLWAASSELGPNACALKTELLCAQVMLDNARDRNVRSPALEQLLQNLCSLAYNADDVLDELEYFRIQDKLEGTHETSEASDRGFVSGLVLNTRHTARAVASKLKLSCSCASAKQDGSDEDQEDAKQNQHAMQVPKLKFDRVEVSKKMKEILDQLRSLRINVASIIPELRHLSPNPATTQLDRPKTTPEIIEPILYGGRDHHKRSIVDNITSGKYSANDLTVLSVVGPGGIGKTTFTQHIYEQVKNRFDIPIWICVSLKFSANSLTQEIVKRILEVNRENKTADSDGEIIRQTLQSQNVLLILDDMWECPEDDWKKLLAPFQKRGNKDNMVIVTTRIPKVAKFVTSKDCSIRLERLNDEECMHFFQACVFYDQHSWDGHANLKNIGREIVKRLKGSPLAVKTVGRLLRENLNPHYWNRVLESREWQQQTNDDDIMPALRLSYNHLPFYLQHCFSYSALFPEDYEFGSEELIHFWIGLGLLETNDQSKRIEDIGEDNLHGLVNYGFIEKKFKEDVHPYYLVHDLLHDLAVDVSASECLIINGSGVGSSKNPSSIRHLSIVVDNADVKDRMTFETKKHNLTMLSTGVKVENLHSLMLFGSQHRFFLKTFRDLFRKAKALRVIFLSGASYNVEDLVSNFSKLVHLRYIRINNSDTYTEASIPSSISRFYHLSVLDLKNCKYDISSLRKMSNLVKIRHFVVPDDQFHSGIFEVGKLKSLQELETFEVKKSSPGFELKQLGQLLELQGSLVIRNLERVEEIGEANEARLAQINHLNQLTLHWDTQRSTKDPDKEQAVLERLKPHSSILKICIKGHGGPSCPTWLGADLAINNLEHLCLQDVAWKSLPPLGKLWMVSEQEQECPDPIPAQSFQNLKSLQLINIPTLRKWCGNDTCRLFTCLEVLIVINCNELVELPFPQSTSHGIGQVENTALFPNLQKLVISDCPKLLSVPRIPFTLSLCKARIENVGSDFPYLSLTSKKILNVSWEEKSLVSQHWNLLCFDNLTEVEFLSIHNKCLHLPLHQMQMLSSLKHLTIESCTDLVWPVEGDRKARHQFPVETLRIYKCFASGRKLTQLLSYFPNLSRLTLEYCQMVTGLGVTKRQTTEIGPQMHYAREEEMEEMAQGLLLLPPQIEKLSISYCTGLSLYFFSADDITLAEGGLQGLVSLRSLGIKYCPRILCPGSVSSCYSSFPASLQDLYLEGVEGMLTLAPLSNLTSLIIKSCDLRGAGIWPLLTQGQLNVLNIRLTPKLLLGTEPSPMREQDGSRCSRLQELETDDMTEIPAMPFFSSLTKLQFARNNRIECFTAEQEGALKKLVSLQELTICYCRNLQSLPAGLSELPILKRFVIRHCPVIMLLPKDGLPSSLTELRMESCRAIQLLPQDSLPCSLQTLYICDCPAIQALPKGNLPNSLVKLDVCYSSSAELRSQCRKLRGTIPIVLA